MLLLVREGKVIGIISWANLVRALATTKVPPATDTEADDAAIRTKLLAELQGKEWARGRAVDVLVRDKVVHLWTFTDQPDDVRQALRVVAENTPGVRGVEEHIVAIPIFPVY